MTSTQTAKTTVTGPSFNPARRARLAANLSPAPAGAIQRTGGNDYHTEYTITLPPEHLARLSDQDLVDMADRSTTHFGGAVERDETAGTAHVTVWID